METCFIVCACHFGFGPRCVSQVRFYGQGLLQGVRINADAPLYLPPALLLTVLFLRKMGKIGDDNAATEEDKGIGSDKEARSEARELPRDSERQEKGPL